MMDLKLGKKPFTPDRRDFKLSRYQAEIPDLPESYNHDGLISDWLMLANDKYGCCVFSGAAHETMLWTVEGGKPAGFTDSNVLSDYASAAGFDPERPETDQGAVPREIYLYRKNTGIVDAVGIRHKIGAFIALDNLNEIKAGIYLFSAVGIGVNLPSSAMKQFNAGQPWTVIDGSYSLGGHYIVAIGYDADWIYVITWGKVQKVSYEFMSLYCEEAWAILSEEMLNGGKSPEGFDLTQLKADLVSISGMEPGPPPEPDPAPSPVVRNDIAELVLVVGSDIVTVYTSDDYFLITLDVPPTIEDDRTLLAVGLLAPYMGLLPIWDEDDRSVTLSNDKIKLMLTIDSLVMVVQKTGDPSYTVELDKAPIIRDGRTLLPIGLIALAIGWKTQWAQDKPNVVRLRNPNIIRVQKGE